MGQACPVLASVSCPGYPSYFQVKFLLCGDLDNTFPCVVSSTWSTAEWSVKSCLVCANTSQVKGWRCRFPLLYLGGIATLCHQHGTGDPGSQKSSFLILLCCSPQSPPSPGTGTPGVAVLWHWGLPGESDGGPLFCWLQRWFDYSQKVELSSLWLCHSGGSRCCVWDFRCLVCSCVISPAM